MRAPRRQTGWSPTRSKTTSKVRPRAREVLARVIDDEIGPDRSNQFQISCAADSGDMSAEGFCDLHRKRTDSARCAGHCLQRDIFTSGYVAHAGSGRCSGRLKLLKRPNCRPSLRYAPNEPSTTGNVRFARDTSKMPSSGEISVSWRFIANSRLPRDVPLLCLASSCGNRFLFTRPFRRQDIRYRCLANHLIRISL